MKFESYGTQSISNNYYYGGIKMQICFNAEDIEELSKENLIGKLGRAEGYN